MTFREYLIMMIGATVVAWAGWFLVLFQINPNEAGGFGLALFFLTLFLGLVGIFATASMSYRVLALHRPLILREARIAFRQALLLAFCAVLSLFLASKDLFSWWVVLLVVGGTLSLEGFSLWIDRTRRS